MGGISRQPRDAAIREQARRQAGHVSRAQLLELGLSRNAIAARVTAGSLVRRYAPGREADAYFPHHHLIVECDGSNTHHTKAAFEDDRERDAENLRHAISTIRITKHRLKADPDREAQRLHEILDRLGHDRSGRG